MPERCPCAEAQTYRLMLQLVLPQAYLNEIALTRLREANLELRDELRRYTAQQTSGA